VRSLRSDPDTSYSARHVVAGTIKYPGGAVDDPREGIVLYVKSSLSGDEPADVLSYHREHTHFPHDSTTNQWFTESQFESYRRLGIHVIHTVFEPVKKLSSDLAGTRSYFETLSKVWYPPPPEMERYGAAHAARYDTLIELIRTNAKLPGSSETALGARADHRAVPRGGRR